MAASILNRVLPTPNGIEVLAAHGQLAGLPAQLTTAPLGGIFLLAELLTQLSQSSSPYDMVVIDLPPARGPILAMALAAATRCIAPVQAEDLVMRALVALLDSSEHIGSRRVNPDLQFSIVRNKYAPRSSADRVFDDLLRTDYAHQLLQTILPIRAALRDSAAMQQSIFHYTGPDASDVRNLFLQLVEELMILERGRNAKEER